MNWLQSVEYFIFDMIFDYL